jgi:hypothetical protein
MHELLVLQRARTQMLTLQRTSTRHATRRRLLPMTAFAAAWFIRGRRRGRGAAIRVVDIILHVFHELVEEKCALEAHLGDCAAEAFDAQARAVVAIFDVVDAAAELDAFSVVSCFDRWREIFLGEGAAC